MVQIVQHFIIEKHLILDRSLGGPDSVFSLGAEEFRQMVKAIRETEKSLGEINYELTTKMKNSKLFSRSLFVVDDIKAGEILTEQNIRSIRPGYGLHPKYFKAVIGKRANIDIKKGTPLNCDLIGRH